MTDSIHSSITPVSYTHLDVYKRQSLGMPDSEASKKPSQFNNIGSSTFFKEFVIPAGAEITLKSERCV